MNVVLTNEEKDRLHTTVGLAINATHLFQAINAILIQRAEEWQKKLAEQKMMEESLKAPKSLYAFGKEPSDSLIVSRYAVTITFEDGIFEQEVLAQSPWNARQLALQDARMAGPGPQFTGLVLSASAKLVK